MNKNGGGLWGILIFVSVVFWPSIFVHGRGKILAEAIWYPLIGLVVMMLAGIYYGEKIYRKRQMSRALAFYAAQNPPDLRESGVFTGEW